MSDVIKLNIKSKSLRAFVPEPGMEFNSFTAVSDEDNIKKVIEAKFQSGFTEGYNNAKRIEDEYTKDLLVKTESFYKILSEFEQKLISYEQSFDKIVIGVSAEIAERILHREISNKTIIQNTLKDAVKKILGANEIIIKINPEDLKFISLDGTQKELERQFSKIRFEQDENVDVGGCLIKSEIGNVDGRVSTQLDEISKQLENIILSEE